MILISIFYEPVDFKEIKTNHVKKILKKTSWKNREKIKTLMRIEEDVIHPPYGLGAGYTFKWLEEQKAYPLILKELNPEKYKNFLKRKKRERKEAEDYRVEEQKMKKEMRKAKILEKKSFQEAKKALKKQ